MIRFFTPTSVLTAAVLALGCIANIGCESSSTEKSPSETAPAIKVQKTPASQPAHDAEHSRKMGKGETSDERDQKDPDGIVRRGSKLAEGKVLKVQECTVALNGKSVKVEGKVTQVCAKKGCWFVIEGDNKEQIRITSKDYKFFVPKDAVGKKAIIEGVLNLKEMSIAEAQHMADDAAESTGKPAEKVTKGKKEMRIAAVSLEMHSL